MAKMRKKNRRANDQMARPKTFKRGRKGGGRRGVLGAVTTAPKPQAD